MSLWFLIVFVIAAAVIILTAVLILLIVMQSRRKDRGSGNGLPPQNRYSNYPPQGQQPPYQQPSPQSAPLIDNPFEQNGNP